MKKTLLTFLALAIGLSVTAQCVPTCSNYAVVPTTFSIYPTTGISIPTTSYSPNADDGYTSPVPLGFSFNFYCTTYTDVLIYTNGLLQFNIGQPSTFPAGYDAAQLIPSQSLPTVLNGMVCFRMDDLDPSVGGTVTYTTVGTSPNQAFVLTYSDVPIYGNASLLNSGQIVLHETSNAIDIITISSPQSPNFATQGVENQAGTVGTAVPGRNQAYWSGTNSAYRFEPFTPLPPSSVAGSTLVCQGTANGYTAATMPGALSYSWALPQGWTGSGTTSAISATMGASGTFSVAANYTCGTSAAAQVQVSVTPAPVVAIASADPFILCDGSTFTITPVGGNNYTVLPGPVVSQGTGPIVITSYGSATYSLLGSDANNCVSINTATVNITSQVTPTVSVNSGSICVGQSFTMQPSGANSYGVTGGFLVVSPTAPGVINYSVTGIGTGTNQCPSNQPAISSLTVNAVPSLTLSTPNTIVCKNETITLAASGASTYSWTNLGLSGPSVTVAPTANTTYSVIGTTTAGCASAKAISIVVTPCTSLPEGVLPVAASVYPNPSAGLFRVVVPSGVAAKRAEVYNSIGQLVFITASETGVFDIQLQEAAPGLYYLKLLPEGGTALKLIKE